MILDLSECEISYKIDIDQDQLSTVPHVATISHLTKNKWVVVNTTESSYVTSSKLVDDHISCDMITSIKLDTDKV